MATKLVKQFITTCTLTFKAFQHNVVMSEGKTTLWNFTTTCLRTKKKYVVYCAPELKKVKSLIKVALKKIPAGHRLVVVTKSFSDADLVAAGENNYGIVTVDVLNKFGEEMLDIKSKEEASDPNSIDNLVRNKLDPAKSEEEQRNKKNSDIIDQALSADKIF